MKVDMVRLVLLVAFVTVLYACSSEDSESCSGTGVSCVGGGTITACCTDTSCRYDLNGVSYPCDGTNCGDAAQRVTNVCLGRASLGTSDTLSVEELLLLEKADNLLLEKEVNRLSNN